MKTWDVWKCDLGHGLHPVVVISHPLRVSNKPMIEVLDCSSQRASRHADVSEVLLDVEDGMDWETLCKCDCVYAVPKTELTGYRGEVTLERRRAIIRTIIKSHGWDQI